MRRMIIAILIIAAMLLVSGCAQNGDVPEGEMGDVVTEDVADVSEDTTDGSEQVDDVVEHITESPAESVTGDEETPTEADNISSISQEDLDKLKDEIEGLEFEDMGGLSE